MVKSQLAERLAAQNPQLYQREVENVLDTMLDEITVALAQSGRVELRGFGAFFVKHREPRIGRDPRTGALVSVPKRAVPFFKAGKELRERLNPPGGGDT
jgi:integration host factor subunit beta